VPTARDRRRRPFALVGALVALVALALLPRVAAAQQCPNILNPACSTSSTEETTSTTEDESTTSTTEFETTSSTNRRSTTTTEEVATTASTVTVSTVNDLLVPGDGTKGAESTTTTGAPVAGSSSGLSDDQLLLIIVTGLGVVAVVSALLTWRYWSATRPVVIDPPSRPSR
jgi:hypothetical protein